MLIEILYKSKNGKVMSREYCHSKKAFIEKVCETNATWKKALKVFFSMEPLTIVRTRKMEYSLLNGKVIQIERVGANV